MSLCRVLTDDSRVMNTGRCHTPDLKEEFQARINAIHVGGLIVCEDEVVFVVKAESDAVADDDVNAGAGREAKVLFAVFGIVQSGAE